MKRVDHVESALVSIGDPIDAIVALAQEVRATAIAADARRVSERLESARYFVSIVGQPLTLNPVIERIVGCPIATWRFTGPRPVTIRFGRGTSHLRAVFRDGADKRVPVAWIDQLASFGPGLASLEIIADTALLKSGVCFTVGAPEMRLPSWRLDSVLTSALDACDLERLETWQGRRFIVVDTTRADDIDDAIASIERLAIETGSHRVESLAVQHRRQLCMRLHHHLFEQQRALGRTEQEMLGRINALTIARVLTENVLDARARQPDPQRQKLADWLSLERTKFVMATKADALIELDERLVEMTQPRNGLRRVAAAAGHQIVVDLLAKLWMRMQAEASKAIAGLLTRLLADLDSSLGDLGETLPLGAMAGADLAPVRGFRRDVEWPLPSGALTYLVDRVGLANRKRIESAARDAVVEMLDTRSSRVVARILDDYDDARGAIERRFCELIDAALESFQVAAELANEAHAGGAGALARARNRVAGYSAALSDLVTRLE